MEQENVPPPPRAEPWEPPSLEEIAVSAEVTAYMGVKDDWD